MQPLWVPGSACWAKDPDRAFVEATVVAVEGTAVTVAVLGPDGRSGEERSCPGEELLPRSVEQRCVAEMDELRELNVAAVLNNVELLFGQQQRATPGEGPNTIYSSVGPVLIAMNPFTELPLYGQQWVQAYRAASADHRASKTLGPHCYRTVEEAYCRLRAVKHQSVVICGESGAGKTVTNRKMLEYLCQVAKRTVTGKATAVGANPEQITEANVLLEAFGNAKTTRNDNSSRFGKYTKLFFNPEAGYSIQGCSVDHYLLERSRVVAQPQQERNYHIFYQLLRSGAGKQYGLQDEPEAYAYTRDGSSVSGFHDAEDFGQLCDAMAKAGFDDAAREHIFSSVAAVVHLGNIEFIGSEDVSKVSPDTIAALENACSLLDIEPAGFARALTSNLIKPPCGAPIQKEVSIEGARAQRDTVAKTIYSRLFDHIVGFIGRTLQRSQSGCPDGQRREREHDVAAIGLLDIFGFEDMMVNGFEQMFINLTNERIQHLFNSIMFERELEAYRSEGITAAFDPGVSNLECVRLFTCPANPPGIVRLLSESALMKTGRDDASFVQVLNSSFARHPSYKVCDPQDAQRMARAKGLKASSRGGLGLDYRECFQVRHYAGTVMYTVKGWVPRSIDALLPHLSEALRVSGKPSVRGLFEKEDAAGKATLGEKFCTQLEALADALEQGETVFVRCVKSNPQMVPGVVNRPLVLEQLVHGGVISALEMRRRGLPERMDYAAFRADFGMLEGTRRTSTDNRVLCGQLLRSIFGVEAERQAQFALGHTKVFMKSHISAFLQAIVSLRMRNLAKRLQRRWRLHMGTERIRKVEEAWQQFQAARRLATMRGIETLPAVAQALEGGEATIGAVVRLLEAARQAHGSDIHRIAAALPPERVSALYGAAEAVDAVVERVSRRKTTAEEVLGLRLTRAMDTSLRLLERVTAVESGCDDVADVVDVTERERCAEACREARRRLEALQAHDLLALKKQGPVGVDFEGEDDPALSEASISPQVNELLEHATGLVIAAETLGHEVLWVRRAFQKAVEEVQGRQEAAQQALEALHEQVQRCIAEGLDCMVEKVNLAWQCQEDAQEVLKAAKDADGYRAAVDLLVAAVSEAEAAAERGREELARREAEKEERRALQAQLDTMQQRLLERRALIMKSLEVRLGNAPSAAKVFADVECLLEEIALLRGLAQSKLDDWRSRIEAVAHRTKTALADVDSQLTQATKARQEEFVRRMSRFNQSPDKTKAEEAPADPAGFLRAEGLTAHEGPLLEILRLMQSMQEAGAPRSGVQRCVSHWLKCTWGGGGTTLQFSPSK